MTRLRLWAFADPARAAWWIIGLFAAYSVLPPLVFGAEGGTAEFAYLDPAVLPEIVRWQWIYAAGALGIVLALNWQAFAGLTTRPDPAGLRLSVWIIAPVVLLFVLVAGLSPLSQPQSVAPLAGLILALNIGVAVMEEVLFRGVLFHGLRARNTLWGAVIGSSLVFGAFHGANVLYGQALDVTFYQCLFAAGIGVLLCGLRLQTDSLWPPIVLHAFWNSYIMAAVASQGALPDPDAPAEFGWFAMALPLGMLWLGCVVIARWHRRTG